MNDNLSLLISAMNRLLPEPHAGLLAGMIFGVRSSMPPEFLSALTTTGTLHMIALSGTNITILTKLIGTALLKIVGRRTASLITVGSIIGFVWFVGPSPSVVRAAIMGSVSLVAVVTGRQVWAFWSWCIAICSMLAIQMDLAVDISFQLSAMASLGLILFSDDGSASQHQLSQGVRRTSIASVINGARQVLLTDFRTTLAAQVFTIPIILLTFHRISIISPLPNLLIAWVLPPITAIGLIVALLSITISPLAQIAAWIAWVPLTYVITVVDLTARLPFASVGF